MGFVDGGREVGKIVNDENVGVGVERDVLNGGYDRLVKVGMEKVVGVNREGIEFVGKGVEVWMVVGIGEVEVVLGELKVEIEEIVGWGDGVGVM